MKKSRLSQEEFLKRAKNKYGNLHDYSSTEYNGFNVPLSIICKQHNHLFEIEAYKYLAGTACPMCGADGRKQKQSFTKEQFIEKAKAKHGDRYSYELVEYENNRSRVIIICNKHGEFKQQAADHLLGQGCRKCAFDKVSGLKRFSKEQFISKALSVHGNKYDYSKVEYTNNSTHVEIICKEHGSFMQSPAVHFSGCGCPNCTIYGYQKNKSGILYILSCGDITKVGITNSKPQMRCDYVSRSCGKEFSVVKTWQYDDGYTPDEIETILLRELRKEYKQPDTSFDGYTECFIDLDIKYLIQRVEMLDEEFRNKHQLTT